MFRLIIVLLLAAVAFYYATLIHHCLVNPIFGTLPLKKLIIPFYGWVQLFKNNIN